MEKAISYSSTQHNEIAKPPALGYRFQRADISQSKTITKEDAKKVAIDTQYSYRTHLTSFAGVLGFEVSRYFAINDRACLTRLLLQEQG